MTVDFATGIAQIRISMLPICAGLLFPFNSLIMKIKLGFVFFSPVAFMPVLGVFVRVMFGD